MTKMKQDRETIHSMPLGTARQQLFKARLISQIILLPTLTLLPICFLFAWLSNGAQWLAQKYYGWTLEGSDLERYMWELEMRIDKLDDGT